MKKLNKSISIFRLFVFSVLMVITNLYGKSEAYPNTHLKIPIARKLNKPDTFQSGRNQNGINQEPRQDRNNLNKPFRDTSKIRNRRPDSTHLNSKLKDTSGMQSKESKDKAKRRYIVQPEPIVKGKPPMKKAPSHKSLNRSNNDAEKSNQEKS